MKQEMKTLNLYTTKTLHVNKDTKIQTYNYHPKTKKELKEVIEKLIKERGNNADLNDIDVSAITDMTGMFYNSVFNGDISEWDVSNVTDMSYMFGYSQFNGDISEWDVSNVENMDDIFHRSLLEKNPPKWYKK